MFSFHYELACDYYNTMKSYKIGTPQFINNAKNNLLHIHTRFLHLCLLMNTFEIRPIYNLKFSDNFVVKIFLYSCIYINISKYIYIYISRYDRQGSSST